MPTSSPVTAVPTNLDFLTQGLQFYYTFSSASVSGFEVADYRTGSPVFNAKLQNGATVSNGQLLLSSSLSQFMSLSAFTTGNNGMSFACWFRSSNSNSEARIFDFGNGPNADNIKMEITNNNLEVNLYGGSSTLGYIPIPIPANNNQWHHVVWVISKYKNLWTLYFDGVSVAQQSVAYPNAISRWINYIGKSNWNVDPYLNGAIRDFRMYNRNLSSVEASLLFTSTQVRKLN